MTEKGGGKDKGQESGPPLLAAMKALLAATSWPIPSRRSSYLGEARLTVELLFELDKPFHHMLTLLSEQS